MTVTTGWGEGLRMQTTHPHAAPAIAVEGPTKRYGTVTAVDYLLGRRDRGRAHVGLADDLAAGSPRHEDPAAVSGDIPMAAYTNLPMAAVNGPEIC